jgi:phosphatidylinositol alpha-mannosyltransferase
MSLMKIAQVCAYNFYRPGGVQIHIKNLSKELRKRGHEVKIITPKVRGIKNTQEDVINLGSCTVIDWNSTSLEIGVAIGKVKDPIKEVLDRENFDIIHFHEPWIPILSAQILSQSKAKNIATFHSVTTDSIMSNSVVLILKPLAVTIIKSLDRIITVSKAAYKYMRKYYKGDIKTVPNGIDLSLYKKRIKPLKKYCDGKVNILFLGRMDKRKGVKYLLRAFRKLKKKNENTRLLLAGDGEQFKEIKKYVKKKRMEDVELLGYVSEEMKLKLFKTCDIYCSPALYGESFGIVLLEAMASGKPIVAYANEGYKTVLTSRGSLLLVKPKDIDGLAGKLLVLCEDKELRKMMGEWGKREVEKYTWDKVCDQVEDIYKEVLAGPSQNKRIRSSYTERFKKWLKKINDRI